MTTYTLRQPDGSTFPPMSINELRRLSSEGGISPEHSIQIEGGQTWHPADKIQGLLQSPNVASSECSAGMATPQKSTQEARGSISNAGGKIQSQIFRQLPAVKGKLLGLKAIIMKSKRNMIIAGSSAVALFLILMIAFSGGSQIQGHLNAVKKASSQMIAAMNSGDGVELLDSLEEVVFVFEDMQRNSEAIKTELASMNEFEKRALVNEVMLAMQQNQSALTPSDDASIRLFTDIATNPVHLQRLQELQTRMERASRNNPFEALVN